MIILNWLYEIRAEVLNNLLFAILANYWLENFMYIHIVQTVEDSVFDEAILWVIGCSSFYGLTKVEDCVTQGC
jgi:hypothetical protein